MIGESGSEWQRRDGNPLGVSGTSFEHGSILKIMYEVKAMGIRVERAIENKRVIGES